MGPALGRDHAADRRGGVQNGAAVPCCDHGGLDLPSRTPVSIEYCLSVLSRRRGNGMDGSRDSYCLLLRVHLLSL